MSHLTRNSTLSTQSHLLLRVFLFLLLLVLFSCCHGARAEEDYSIVFVYGRKMNPSYGLSSSLLKRMRYILPSGPSKQHNSIGLERKHLPWRRDRQTNDTCIRPKSTYVLTSSHVFINFDYWDLMQCFNLF